MVFMTKTQLQVTSALHYQRGTTRNSCFRHSQVMLQHQLLPRRPLHSRMAAASQVNCTLHNPSSSSVCPWPWRRRTLRIDNCVLPPCPNSTAVTSSGRRIAQRSSHNQVYITGHTATHGDEKLRSVVVPDSRASTSKGDCLFSTSSTQAVASRAGRAVARHNRRQWLHTRARMCTLVPSVAKAVPRRASSDNLFRAPPPAPV